MKPDGEDLIINKNRKDSKFTQKVRNMISHRDTNGLLEFCTYSREKGNGFLISNTIDIELEERERIKLGMERSKRRRSFISRKVDFEDINKRNKEIGDMGEEFIYNIEKKTLPKDTANKVKHVSKEVGDGAGYDILSYSKDNNVRFVEVKTTTGSKDTPFYLSENEKIFLEEQPEAYEINRVYNFNTTTKNGEVDKISGVDFMKNYTLEPVSYKVKPKK